MTMRPYVLLPILLAGCAHSPDVLEMGAGSYSLTGEAHSNCPAGSREEAVDQAKDYCERRHQKPQIESFDDKIEGPLRCTSSIVFRCE